MYTNTTLEEARRTLFAAGVRSAALESYTADPEWYIRHYRRRWATAREKGRTDMAAQYAGQYAGWRTRRARIDRDEARS